MILLLNIVKKYWFKAMVQTITVHRKGYYRKPYTRADGTRVKGAWVPATTFKRTDVGSKGVRSRGAKQGLFSKKKGYKPWITREGKLGGPGYFSKPAATRHRILNECVRGYGYRSCLGSLMVLNRSRELKKKYGAKIDADKNVEFAASKVPKYLHTL